MCQTCRAFFLICSHDQTHPFIQRYVHVTQHFHGNHCRDNRAFIIADSAAVQDSVLFRHDKRVRVPSVFLMSRHDIQMTDDTDLFFPFSHFGIAGIMVDIGCTETVFRHHVKGTKQCLLRTFTKRCVRCRCSHFAVDGDQFPQTGKQLVTVSVHHRFHIHSIFLHKTFIIIQESCLQ